MQRLHRYLGSLFLTAALVSPVAIRANVTQQEDRHQDDRDHRDHKRYYDRDHRDYHNWDDNEDRAYRQYLAERREQYRAFTRLKRREQSEYWNWRHAHPDSDRH
jgi:hypothetical protein